MGILTIKGDRKYLDVIAKENRARVSKYGLEISIEDEGKKAAEKSPNTEAPKKKTTKKTTKK